VERVEVEMERAKVGMDNRVPVWAEMFSHCKSPLHLFVIFFALAKVQGGHMHAFPYIYMLSLLPEYYIAHALLGYFTSEEQQPAER